jgi:hypothetical protein
LGERLKADLGQISLASRQLSGLAAEFGRATALSDLPETVVGDAGLSGTLAAFAGNWSIHRQRLIDDLTKLSENTAEAVKAYNGTDESLASALAKMTEGG